MRAAVQGMLEVLEYEHRGTLAEHESGPRGIEGPACGGRVIVAVGYQRSHDREAGRVHRVLRRFRSATDHDRCLAVADLLERFADRLGAGGAGRGQSQAGTTHAESRLDAVPGQVVR